MLGIHYIRYTAYKEGKENVLIWELVIRLFYHWNTTYGYAYYHILSIMFIVCTVEHYIETFTPPQWVFSYLHRIKIYIGGSIKFLLVLRVKMLSNEMKTLEHSIKLDLYWHFVK